MQSDFFIALIAVSAVLSMGAAWFAASAAARVSELRDQFEHLKALQQDCKTAPAVQLTERLTELEEIVSRLANSAKMAKVRAAALTAEREPRGFPDPYKEPDRWRQEMNSKLARDKFGLG